MEVANRTARGTASPNVRGMFAAFSTSNARQMTNQASNRAHNAFNQQANYKPRGAPSGMQTSTVASYNTRYVAPNVPLQRKPLICYTCGKPGHKSVECRSKLLTAPQSGNFVTGQRPPKRLGNLIDNKQKLPYSNMVVLSDKDESDSIDDGIILAAGDNTCQTGILAVNGSIARTQIEDLIVDTWSAVSLVSSQFYDTIPNGGKLNQLNDDIWWRTELC